MDDAAGKPVIGAAHMVDLARYPIAGPDSAAGAAFRQACRERFLDDGLCVLPGFIRPEALEALVREAEGFAGDAWFCRNTHNVYLTGHDPGTLAGNVAGRQERTFVGSVPYDRIGEDSPLRRLYLWDPLKDFVGAVLGKERLHRFADPLGACSVNVFVDGGEHGWHFDESEFTITLMLQPPESGGNFEYVPRIRGARGRAGDRRRSPGRRPPPRGRAPVHGGRPAHLRRPADAAPGGPGAWSPAPPRTRLLLRRTTRAREQRNGAQAVLGPHGDRRRSRQPPGEGLTSRRGPASSAGRTWPYEHGPYEHGPYRHGCVARDGCSGVHLRQRLRRPGDPR